MNRRFCLAVFAILIMAMAGPDAFAKKKRPPAEGPEVLCPDKGKKLTFTGQVHSIQPGAKEITIRAGSGSKEFRIAGNCKISTKDKADASLTDLKLGDEVRVTYFTTKLDTEVACIIAPSSKSK